MCHGGEGARRNWSIFSHFQGDLSVLGSKGLMNGRKVENNHSQYLGHQQNFKGIALGFQCKKRCICVCAFIIAIIQKNGFLVEIMYFLVEKYLERKNIYVQTLNEAVYCCFTSPMPGGESIFEGHDIEL